MKGKKQAQLKRLLQQLLAKLKDNVQNSRAKRSTSALQYVTAKLETMLEHTLGQSSDEMLDGQNNEVKERKRRRERHKEEGKKWEGGRRKERGKKQDIL